MNKLLLTIIFMIMILFSGCSYLNDKETTPAQTNSSITTNPNLTIIEPSCMIVDSNGTEVVAHGDSCNINIKLN